jgi:hypothetical protein
MIEEMLVVVREEEMSTLTEVTETTIEVLIEEMVVEDLLIELLLVQLVYL